MLDRTVAPSWGTIVQPDLQSAIRTDTTSGIPIYHISAGAQPVVKIEILLKSGLWYESSKSLSWFTAKMLAEGTSTKSGKQISEAFESLGAFLEITAGFDDISIVVYGLKKNFDQVLVLLSEIFNDSIFPEKEMELLKSIRKNQIKLNDQKSNLYASKKLRAEIYGADYPYGQILAVEDIDAIDRTSIVSFFEKGFFNQPEIFLSGQVSDELIGQVSNILKLPTHKVIVAHSHQSKMQAEPLYIERADSLQSSVRLAWHIPKKTDENYFNYLIANNLLGGYFGSRLMKNIREDKGYTYGINAYPVHLQHASFGMIATDVKAVNTQDTLDEIKVEIDRLINEPIDDTEIKALTNYMAGSFLSSINTPFELMEKFKKLHQLDLDDSYYQQYFEALQNVTEAKIKQAINKHFDLTKAYQVVVGVMK